MLAGVLLHVIAPALTVDREVHERPALDGNLQSGGVDEVHDITSIGLRDFGNAKPDLISFSTGPTRIKELPAACRIEGAAVQDHTDTLAIGREFQDFGVKLQQLGIGVVEPLGHKYQW